MQADRLLCLVKLLAHSFGSLQPFTVRKIGDFLSALPSNNQFITVDREIFAVEHFSPVAKAAKIKRAYISYVKKRYAAKINRANISYAKKKAARKFSDLRY